MLVRQQNLNRFLGLVNTGVATNVGVIIHVALKISMIATKLTPELFKDSVDVE